MAWPQTLDYNEAIQNPSYCFLDPELRQGVPAADAMGVPRVCTGSFAAVYKMTCPGSEVWAVKCFIQDVPDLQQRYKAISDHLGRAKQQGGLPFMVEFAYLEQGIRVSGR